MNDDELVMGKRLGRRGTLLPETGAPEDGKFRRRKHQDNVTVRGEGAPCKENVEARQNAEKTGGRGGSSV